MNYIATLNVNVNADSNSPDRKESGEPAKSACVKIGRPAASLIQTGCQPRFAVVTHNSRFAHGWILPGNAVMLS